MSQLIPSEYFNISQYRLDHWNTLREQADKLYSLSKKNSDLSLIKGEIDQLLLQLSLLEQFWAFPGTVRLYELKQFYIKEEYAAFSHKVAETVRILVSKFFFFKDYSVDDESEEHISEFESNENKNHYFEVLIIDALSDEEEEELREVFAELRESNEEFRYDLVFARSFEDALICIMFNPYIQSCVIRYGFSYSSRHDLGPIRSFIAPLEKVNRQDTLDGEMGPVCGEVIKLFRPELDLFLVTDTSMDDINDDIHDNFRRIFYRQEDLQDLHLSILKGIQRRFETPFFTALKNYSQQPTGVFHAMPISRGNSIFKSNWIKEMSDFYGRNIFLAETSATTGGLDSLLQPTGPLKRAQEFAARAFGANRTFFVTNGTSTANKIVLQALIQPDDIILIDRDCHKSHHYALVLSGAHVVYLDSYPIEKYSMYGGVSLESIKKILKKFKKEGKLDKVKMLILTNCTFDGIVYNTERIMSEILEIKKDMIFLWDEAWFGFAYFNKNYRQRTGMGAAQKLQKRFLAEGSDKKVRVYVTQSTHKTLTSLRQGSMIHIFDEDFNRKVEDVFHEAYMTHTSTSPSYQILASLDVGRRQVELEGNEMVEKSIERAMILRSKITDHPILKRYFDVITVEEFIPEVYRKSGLKKYYDSETGWNNMENAWEEDEFVLDPTKINIFIGRTGVDGDAFKKDFLMDQFGIQINKTTRNTVLFMTNIGTTRSSAVHLIGVLIKIAKQIEAREKAYNSEEFRLHEETVKSLTLDLPPLPDFSSFHPKFKADPKDIEGKIRVAFFLSYKEENCLYMKLDECIKKVSGGGEVVAATFVIPYPPGFPILVPGQVITNEILKFMKALDVKEIHSFNPKLGFKVFKEEVLI
ncbi:MAG: aminotransferase class I/II-fold pyridoxal phosphate-dependent enzyme [Vicingaceae bacterium]